MKLRMMDCVEIKKGEYKGQIGKVMWVHEIPSFLGTRRGPSQEIDVHVYDEFFKKWKTVKGMSPASLKKVDCP